MPEANIRHELACDEDTFWDKCFFDKEFLDRLFMKELKMKGFEVVSQEDDGKTLHRKCKVDPPVEGVPGPVKKAIGDSFTYIEDGTFDRATKRWKFKVLPSAFGDKSNISGEIWCEKLGDKKVARCAKMSVSVKVFMIGSIIEDKIVSDLKTSYDKAADFTNRFLKEKGL